MNIVVQWVNSKVQFMSSADKSDDFKLKFKERFSDYFEGQAVKLVDFEAIEKNVTINLDDTEKDRAFF